MEQDKPLHVRVAEALGWTGIEAGNACGGWDGVAIDDRIWIGRPPGELVVGCECPPIHRYDTDWSATGPLIEQFGIALDRGIFTHGAGWRAGWTHGPWDDIGAEWWARNAEGRTPTEAICNLILTLHEAGRLK